MYATGVPTSQWGTSQIFCTKAYVANGGFEAGSTTDAYEYAAPPSWQSSSNDKPVFIKTGNSAWGGTVAAAGNYFLGLQMQGSFISQSIPNHIVGQTYNLGFQSAKRGGSYETPTLEVIIDGVVKRKFDPASTTFALTTVGYVASTSSVDIKFLNAGAAGDRTAFLDGTKINPSDCVDLTGTYDASNDDTVTLTQTGCSGSSASWTYTVSGMVATISNGVTGTVTIPSKGSIKIAWSNQITYTLQA
jgi:hypothetical protein